MNDNEAGYSLASLDSNLFSYLCTDKHYYSANMYDECIEYIMLMPCSVSV